MGNGGFRLTCNKLLRDYWSFSNGKSFISDERMELMMTFLSPWKQLFSDDCGSRREKPSNRERKPGPFQDIACCTRIASKLIYEIFMCLSHHCETSGVVCKEVLGELKDETKKIYGGRWLVQSQQKITKGIIPQYPFTTVHTHSFSG